MSTAERVERRLTAILAADVVGYSRLMSADEEGTLAQLKGHRCALVDPKIAENRGHDTRVLNIQHTVRYTELTPKRFQDFWRA